MADIIDIDVFQTVTSVSFEVEPNTNIININKVTGSGGSGGFTNLSTTQTASNFTINSDTGDDALVPLGNGTLAGATLNDYTTAEKNKLSGIATGAEVNVNADWNATTGDAQILNKPTISGTNTGDQNLQSVTNLGATTDNTITINPTVSTNGLNINTTWIDGEPSSAAINLNLSGEDTGIIIDSANELGNGLIIYGNQEASAISVYSAGTGIFLNSPTEGIVIADGGELNTGISVINANGQLGINLYQQTGVANFINLGSTAEGLGINSGTSSTGNFIRLNKNGVDKLVVNQAGELTAQKLIKDGGTSSQILAADGSVITAGTNITITGGQISSVGGTGGGGSSVNYYLNGGTSQGTFGGTTYYEFSKTAVIGTGADFNISSNGYIASFITDVADPSLLLIPAGSWNLEFFFSSSSAGGIPSFYVELYKYDGTTFTSIASSSATPEGITNGTSIDAYFTSLAVPETILTVNDRLAIRVFVNASSKTITLHTQNGHLCEVITTFSAGLTALNGLQAQVQNFATGTTGTDFAINSSGSTHTFNLPSASATARGVVSTASQTFAGDKTFTGAISASNLSGTNTGDQNLSGYALLASPTFTGTPSLPTGTTGTTQSPLNNSTRLATTAYVEAACSVVAASNGVTVSSQDTFGTSKIATVTAAQYAAFVTAGTVSATTLYFITA